ncbi:MAG TPA: hypothetical protein VMT12_12795 [Syntrophales bacterium]|nr:hypothetical protein [Syntrophales bacterium]
MQPLAREYLRSRLKETVNHSRMRQWQDRAANRSRRIGIFFAMGTLETVSSLRDGVKLLAEHGYSVDIFLSGNPAYPRPQFDDKMISVVSDKAAVFTHAKVALPNWTFGRGLTLYSWFVLRLYGSFWRNIVFKPRLRSRHSQSRYSCLIGIDQEAIADTARYANYLKVPFIYWSLELRFTGQCGTEEEKSLKEKDIRYSRQAAFAIIQDEWRKEALINENGVDAARIMIVPNAPMGNAHRDRNNFLQKRWNIPLGKKVIICAGTLAWWAMSKEIVKAANNWPDDFMLVMHSRRKPDMYGAKYESEIMSLANPMKVIVSFDQFTASEYHQMLDSADVGIAFYSYTSPYTSAGIDMNMKIMGLSSGKIADYLQHGLPVIVNEVTGPKELITDYQCGVAVPHADRIAEALSHIFHDYDTFSAHACKCFNERLELSSHFKKVIQKIGSLRCNSPTA